ncbi:MAG: four helix bundle protein [bacterium]|nr:four helix bundle protein [bacterium]
MPEKIRSYRDLNVFNTAMEASMVIFHLSKNFPREERYSMTDQIRRSSRSVCANLAEAWRKRRYKAAFIAKLNDVESEACETLVWLDYAFQCGYIEMDEKDKLLDRFETVIRQIVKMILTADKWIIPVKI